MSYDAGCYQVGDRVRLLRPGPHQQEIGVVEKVTPRSLWVLTTVENVAGGGSSNTREYVRYVNVEPYARLAHPVARPWRKRHYPHPGDLTSDRG